MNKKFPAILLALAFVAAPFKPVFAFECEVVEVTKKEIVMQCQEATLVGNGVKVKSKLKVEPIKK